MKNKKLKQFMLESNQIEGEDRINPGDLKAIKKAIKGINTLDDILEIHKILGEYLKKDWVGRFRKVNVTVSGYYAPPQQEIKRLMNKYIKLLPDMDSFETHNEFELIHPFRDLNGRVGRLIWLSKAIHEGYNFDIPFLQMYYYQTLERYKGGPIFFK